MSKRRRVAESPEPDQDLRVERELAVEQRRGNGEMAEALEGPPPFDFAAIFSEIRARLEGGMAGEDPGSEDLLPMVAGRDEDLGCWNTALYGGEEGAVDPRDMFEFHAKAPDSPYKKGRVGSAMVPRGQGPSSSRAQEAWHRRMAQTAISAAGMRPMDGSELQMSYQYLADTAMYHHWEMWYDGVGVASFPGQPIHAKQTATDDEAIVEIMIGIDPASLSDKHKANLRQLASGDSTRKHGDIYG